MKLEEFTNNLIKLMEYRPETKNFDVVSSRDDEGNGYNLVYFTPTVGNYDEDDKEFEPEKELNAVCIN